jgi:hypothetical protein
MVFQTNRSYSNEVEELLHIGIIFGKILSLSDL